MGEIRNGIFYNDSPASRRPRTNVEKIAGRAPIWLGIIAWIHRHRGNSTDICAEFGIHRNTLVGYLRDIESVYGVVIRYERPDSRYSGWYVIDNWGVLDRSALLGRYRTPL